MVAGRPISLTACMVSAVFAGGAAWLAKTPPPAQVPATTPGPSSADVIAQRLDRVEQGLAIASRRMTEVAALVATARQQPSTPVDRSGPARVEPGQGGAGSSTLSASAAEPPSDVQEPTPEQVAARADAAKIVASALAGRTWRESDREQWRSLFSQLDDDTRREMTQTLVVALNKGDLRLDFRGPPL
jgi:hypothetical protein